MKITRKSVIDFVFSWRVFAFLNICAGLGDLHSAEWHPAVLHFVLTYLACLLHSYETKALGEA